MTSGTENETQLLEGRIRTQPPLVWVPEFLPVAIATSFVQGAEVAQAVRCPELAGTLEATLFGPTG